MIPEEEIRRLTSIASGLRKDALEALYYGGSGHPGSALSCADMVTALYFHVMNIKPENPDWEDRDRFILSKGHACPIYYAALAERGFFGKEHLKTLRQPDSILQGHPVKGKAPGVDMSSGSLGQGLSLAVGMALYGKKEKKDYYTYCILGDGESAEGQIWEAAMSAGHFGLDHLVCMLDANHLQIDGTVEEVMNGYPFMDKFRAFGWNTLEVDGHDFRELTAALEFAKSSSGRPTFIQCNTVKGKGVSFMENRVEWHGGTVTKEVLDRALEELQPSGGDVS